MFGSKETGISRSLAATAPASTLSLCDSPDFRTDAPIPRLGFCANAMASMASCEQRAKSCVISLPS